MAHSLSAKKRVRQNVKHRAINRWRVQRVREAIKTFRETVHAGKFDEAQTQLTALYRLLDKVASTPSMHKNTASRYKGRLTAHLNAAKAPKPAAA